MPAGCGQLSDAQVGVQGQGQQHPAGGVVEVGDAQAEQVLDVVGQGQVAEVVEVAPGQRPAHLEHEQRVAHRGLVDPPQQVVGQPQPEPGGQHLPGGAEADRPDDDASACSSGNAFSRAVRRPGAWPAGR